ncbi:MAG: oligoendopeptidase F [Clostridia bacterium]|nr:oligoendopeptidase F [Clostridia bacterium]
MKNSLEWNLSDIYNSNEEINQDFKEIYSGIEKIKKYKGTFKDSSENVASCYKLLEYLLELEEKIYGYAMLNYHRDMSNKEAIKLYKRAEKMGTDFSVSTSFIEPELSSLEDGVLEKYLEENEILNKEFNKSIKDIIKNKKHILQQNIEETLAEYIEVLGSSENIYDVLTNIEFEYPSIIGKNGEKLKVTDGLFSIYLKDLDQNIRKQAFDSVYSLYRKHINSITEMYLSRVKARCISSKLRKYKSSLEAAVEADDSNVIVYKTLIDNVNKNLSLNYEYLELKKKLLNIKKIHVYDVYANPLEEGKSEILYSEGKKIVLDALEIMGKDYINNVKFAMENGWIDVEERQNKMSGGYSMGIHTVHPYILLNYVNSSRDVSTLAHELGHTMHSYYASKSQNIINANYTIMIAEVASTVNEILLANYLINKETDRKKKAALINDQLDTIRATLFRQTMFAEFEMEVHEKIENGESLTSEDLNNIYLNLVKKYFGKDVEIDDTIKYEWARIPHFYRCFYVYKYATGITSGVAIATKILEKEPNYIKRYIDMLSKGGKEGSLELLNSVDVNLEKGQTYDFIFKYFEKNLKELKNLI